VTWTDRFEKRERFKGSPQAGYDYIVGGYENMMMGAKGMAVEVSPSSGGGGKDDIWDLHVHGPGSFTIQCIRPLDKAMRVALYLYDELEAEHTAEQERRDAQYREFDLERKARDEAERPAREAAARKREKRLEAAEIVEAAKCPECDHVGDPDDFDEPLYECSQDGATARGYDDGRICDQCHKFRAKVSDTSCPQCEQAVEPEHVQAKEIDNEYVEVEAAA
jgi:hypothetical protein